MSEGLADLGQLLRGLKPVLLDQDFLVLSEPALSGAQFETLQPLATVREAEGITLVVEVSRAAQAGLRGEPVFACISLHVHSSLESVGLTAAISTALAKAGISANMLAGFYHDHLLIPRPHALEALQVLERLSRAAQQASGA